MKIRIGNKKIVFIINIGNKIKNHWPPIMVYGGAVSVIAYEIYKAY